MGNLVLRGGFMSLVVTQSKLRAFMECPKKALLKQAGIHLENTGERTAFGIVWHDLIEDFMNTPNKDNFSAKEKIADSELSYVDKEIMLALFEQWKLKCPYVNSVVENEVYLENSNFIKGVTLAGKADGIEKLNDGRFRLIERKTKKQVNEQKIMENLYSDLQCMMYDVLTGGKIKQVIYDVVRRPSLRQSVKEDDIAFAKRCVEDINSRPEWYVMFFTVELFAEDHERAEEYIAILATNFKKAVNGKIAQPNVCACTEGNYPCDYVDFCRYGDYLQYRVDKKINTELPKQANASKKWQKRLWREEWNENINLEGLV